MSRRRALVIAGAVAGGLVVVALVALPGIVSARVDQAVADMLADSVDADVTVGDVDVSLFRSFPTVSVALTDLAVTGRDGFADVELVRLPQLDLGIDLFSAIAGSTLTIERVSSRGGRVHVVYDADGHPNWDILGEAGEESSDSTLELDRVEIADLAVTYEDRASGLVTEVEDIDGTATATLTPSTTHVSSNATVDSLTMRYGGVTWLRATRWEADLEVDIDEQTGAVTFGENRIQVNELPLTFSGVVTPVDDAWDLDLDVEATDTSFAALLSLVPEAYTTDFSGVDASGKIRCEGTIDGKYDGSGDTLPGFELDLDVEDGRFQFPDLPSAVDRVAARVHLSHPGGEPDKLEIDAKHFELTVGGASLRGRVAVDHPISDPDLDAMVDGRLDLGALRRALPQASDAPDVDGVLDLDFTVKGRMSDFEQQRVERINADGTIRGKDLRFQWYEQPVEVERVDVALSPLKTDVNELSVRSMGSDGALSGHIDNLFPWMLSDADLSGTLALRAGQIDLRPFQGESDEPSDEAVLFVVPDNVDLTLDADAERILSDDFTMRDVKGKVTVRDGVMALNRLNGRMLGGRVTLSGTYAASTVDKADIDMQITTQGTDLGDTIATFETLAVIAPVLKRAVGDYDAQMSLATTLGPDGSPDLSVVTSFGDISPRKMTMQSAALNTVASQLKNDQLAVLDLAAVRMAYAFEKGRVDLDPFKVKLGKQSTTVSGGFGPLDRSLDLKLALPVDTGLIRGAKVLGSFGGNLPKKVDVEARISGTYDKPKVRVGVAGQAVEEAVDAALDPLIAAATAEGDKLLAEARAAADKLLAEADKAADVLIAEAKKKARKLKRDAKGKPLQEAAAEAAAKLLEDEADKAARKVLKEAEKAADKLVDEAQKKRDQLIDKATTDAKRSLR